VAIWNEIDKIDWTAEFHEMNAEEIYTKLCNKLAQVCVHHTLRKTGLEVRSIPRDQQILMRKRKQLNKQIAESTGNMRRWRLVD
jgi:glutamate/tyrosine decarboxylase-like PLP-dependent enzyme